MKNSLLVPIALITTAFTTPVFAHDNSCDVELDGHIQYYQGLLTVEMQNGSTLTIDDRHELTINGEITRLNSTQQQWVDSYYENIDTAIPMTLSIAREGLEIANIAVTEVFGELLGDGNGLTEDFDALFVSLNDKLNASFYDASGNIHVDSTQFDEPGWFDESWEAEFEEQVESLITQSMGSILIAVGAQMLGSGGDMGDFEAKMERFGEDIEYLVESEAAALEVKADALCEVLQKANYAEEQMQASIPGLDDLDLLNMHDDDLKM